MQKATDEDLAFKIILIGDQGVGKSSILMRYIQNEFKTDYSVTIGVEFTSKEINIDPETIIKLQIWDTVIPNKVTLSQESFRAIVRSFYRNASAVFLIYQINKKETFLNLKGWLEEVRENSNPNVILVLMGNQCDRADREVSFEEGDNFMRENDIHFFFETSARDGYQIDQAFEEAAKMIFVNYVGQAAELLPQTENTTSNQNSRKTSTLAKNNNNINLNASSNNKPTKKKGCC